jgi:hypothetical protein
MEVSGVVKNGRIELSSPVELPEGAHVPLILETEHEGVAYDREPISAESVEADLAWATGERFDR